MPQRFAENRMQIKNRTQVRTNHNDHSISCHVYILQSKGKKPFYIVKPDEGSQGDGIYLITEAKEYLLNNKRHVVQEYLADPLLLEDLKFDFRLYVLIASLEPLKVRDLSVF